MTGVKTMVERYQAATVQLDIQQGDKQKNLSRAMHWIDCACEAGAKIVCLPEYFSTGYMGNRMKEVAESIPGSTIEILIKKAVQKKIFIVAGSIVEKKDANTFYNTSAFIGPEGKIIGLYRKTHPWHGAPKDESGQGIIPGEEFPVFETELGKTAILIDCDLDFPEPTRIMALEGAEVIFWPSHCSGKWIDSHRYGVQQRAFENMVYMVGANRVGTLHDSAAGDVLFLGSSRIISPMGEIMASAGEFNEGFAIASIDISKLRKSKQKFNMLSWRNPDTYRRLILS